MWWRERSKPTAFRIASRPTARLNGFMSDRARLRAISVILPLLAFPGGDRPDFRTGHTPGRVVFRGPGLLQGNRPDQTRRNPGHVRSDGNRGRPLGDDRVFPGPQSPEGHFQPRQPRSDRRLHFEQVRDPPWLARSSERVVVSNPHQTSFDPSASTAASHSSRSRSIRRPLVPSTVNPMTCRTLKLRKTGIAASFISVVAFVSDRRHPFP